MIRFHGLMDKLGRTVGNRSPRTTEGVEMGEFGVRPGARPRHIFISPFRPRGDSILDITPRFKGSCVPRPESVERSP